MVAFIYFLRIIVIEIEIRWGCHTEHYDSVVAVTYLFEI